MIYKRIFLIIILIFCLFPFTLKAQEIKPIKILLVPGHDANSPGAQYGNLKEMDMNLVLATKIYNLLKKDKRFSVEITRDNNGYTKKFSEYFLKQKDNIISFREESKKMMKEKISTGNFIPVVGVPHNMASSKSSMILYGINKWANENKIDAVIHIHFNDIVRKNKWVVADTKGFAIYMPQDQMVNSTESIVLAKNIFTELEKKYSTSNFYLEKGGLIKEQKLIALGANGTLNKNVRSILIEYGYIYRFGNSTFRHNSYKTMAELTVKGIENSFLLPAKNF